jgi:hypothetical protein
VDQGAIRRARLGLQQQEHKVKARRHPRVRRGDRGSGRSHGKVPSMLGMDLMKLCLQGGGAAAAGGSAACTARGQIQKIIPCPETGRCLDMQRTWIAQLLSDQDHRLPGRCFVACVEGSRSERGRRRQQGFSRVARRDPNGGSPRQRCAAAVGAAFRPPAAPARTSRHGADAMDA